MFAGVILASGLYEVHLDYGVPMVLTGGQRVSHQQKGPRSKRRDGRESKSTATPIIIRAFSIDVPDGHGTLAPGEER